MINRWSIMLGSRDLGNCIIALASTPEDNGKIFDLFYDESNPLVWDDREWLNNSHGRWAIVEKDTELSMNRIVALATTVTSNSKVYDLLLSTYGKDKYVLSRGLVDEEDEVCIIGYCGEEK